LLDFLKSEINKILQKGASERMTDKEFIINEINEFRKSPKRTLMMNGERYYKGDHDILRRKRTVIGAEGKLEEVTNIPNNRIVDNQYKKMVVQKSNYLLGKPFSIDCENDTYAKILKSVFNRKFQRLLKNIGDDALNAGIGWLYIYYNDNGEFAFRRFKPTEIIPFWKDAEHTVLEGFIRVYSVITYIGKTKKIVDKVEVYGEKGIDYYEMENQNLTSVEPYHQSYFMINDENYNWAKIPLIAFKYNPNEIPLIKMVKSLQDGLNLIISNFQNNMEEDMRNTIMVLVNYDGENLGQFRKNLATYGAVKVKTVDGTGGDVKTLQIEVNSDNYKAIIEIFKKAIIENAMGYDAKDDRLSGNPNQMNIQSMYSDIDLDANGMETEFQAAFEELLWFVNCHLANVGYGDFENEEVKVIFDRDMLMNESEIIENCQKSEGILSDETIVANHPWVDNPQKELERVKQQKEEEINQYNQAFSNPVNKSTEE